MLKINGIEFNSDDYLLTDMGDIQTAKKRVVETVNIHGANGSYVVHDEGYESAERELVFSVKEFDKISKLRSAFNDFDNILEFDYISNSKYIADFVEMKYARQGKSRWLITIKLMFDPFRYALDSGVVTLGANGSIENIGDVFSEPIIEIEGTGDVTLTIGDQVMVLNITGNKVRIDCRHKKQNIYDSNGYPKNSWRVRGGFFEIQPGTQGVRTIGSVSKVKIDGNWRWRV